MASLNYNQLCLCCFPSSTPPGARLKQPAVGRELDPHEDLEDGDGQDHPRVLPQPPAFGVRDELVVTIFNNRN